MSKPKLTCSGCGNWIMGIPLGRCGHPSSGFLLFTTNKMVDEDAGEECPLNKQLDESYKPEEELITLKFTKEEIRALQAILWTNPCSSGCAYAEMEKTDIDCVDCELTKSTISLIDKIDIL